MLNLGYDNKEYLIDDIVGEALHKHAREKNQPTSQPVGLLINGARNKD